MMRISGSTWLGKGTRKSLSCRHFWMVVCSCLLLMAPGCGSNHGTNPDAGAAFVGITTVPEVDGNLPATEMGFDNSGTTKKPGVDEQIVGPKAPSAADGYEPDNDMSQARMIYISESDQSENHTIEPVGDLDWFKFTAEANVTYYFYSSGSLDGKLHIYDSSGQFVTEDDDSGVGLNFNIVWLCPAAGTYYLKARHYSDQSTGAYTIYYRKAFTTYQVTGRIRTTDSTYLDGVLLEISNGGGQAVSSGGGYWTKQSLGNGTYTITPYKPGYWFSPPSKTVTINNGNLSGYNFIASNKWYAYGYVRKSDLSGIAGVTVTISNGGGTATTNSAGYWSKGGLVNGSYTATPSKNGWWFAPVNKSFSINDANAAYVNFYGSDIFTVSGRTRTSDYAGISGVTIQFSNNGGSTTTDASGNYSKGGLSSGTYTITPSKSGWVFEPPNKTVTLSDANLSGRNFIGSQSGDAYEPDNNSSQANWIYPGASVNSQSRTFHITTDDDWVKFTGYSGTTYNLYSNGSLDTYAVLYASDASTVVDYDDDSGAGGINFMISWLCTSTGTYYLKMQSYNHSYSGAYTFLYNGEEQQDTYQASGYIKDYWNNGVSSVTVTITDAGGGSAGSDATDSSGYWAVAGLTDGDYTATPSRSGYGFLPNHNEFYIAGVDYQLPFFTGFQLDGVRFPVGSADTASGYQLSLRFQQYNPDFGNYHLGDDWWASGCGGDPVYAIYGGTVTRSTYADGMGNYVMVHHVIRDVDVTSTYWHLQSTAVSQGNYVNKGDIVGYIGHTGGNWGDHLHFEMRWGNGTVTNDGYHQIWPPGRRDPTTYQMDPTSFILGNLTTAVGLTVFHDEFNLDYGDEMSIDAPWWWGWEDGWEYNGNSPGQGSHNDNYLRKFYQTYSYGGSTFWRRDTGSGKNAGSLRIGNPFYGTYENDTADSCAIWIPPGIPSMKLIFDERYDTTSGQDFCKVDYYVKVPAENTWPGSWDGPYNCEFSGGGNAIYSGSNWAWSSRTLWFNSNLTAGHYIKFRFVFTSDGNSESRNGWDIDNVRIKVG